MAQDKQLARLEAKLDALLKANKIDMAQFEQAEPMPSAPRKLSAAEQEATDNAPKAEATIPDNAPAPRTTAQNAPDVSSSVPKGKK